MFKKIADFFKTKTECAIIANTSVQDYYESAALKIIAEIKKLKVRHVQARENIVKFNKIADEKDEKRARMDKDILRLRRESPEADASTRVKLALVYKRSAEGFRKQAESESGLLAEIESAVRDLDYQKDDLAIKLELIRETQDARDSGLQNIEDIISSVELVSINVEEMMNKAQVFKGDDMSSTTLGSGEVEDYLAQLEAK